MAEKIGKYEIKALADWEAFAKMLLARMGQVRIWSLEGTLGAGKTTLVKALSAELGVVDQVRSPTFALINSYQRSHNEPLYHMDLYRLTEKKALEALDLPSYWESGSYCFVEWGEKLAGTLPLPHLKLTIAMAKEGRVVEVTLHQ